MPIDWSRVRAALDGRAVVLIGQPADHLRGLESFLIEAFGASVLVVGNDSDASALPLGYSNSTATFQRLNEALSDPPEHLLARLRAFDPSSRAVVIADSNTVVRSLDGRPVLDSRDPSIAALEFPGAADEVWSASGLAVAPSALLDDFGDGFGDAVAKVDLGYGALCFGDMRSPVHEALESARFVSGTCDAAAAANWLALGSARGHVQAVPGGVPVAGPGLVVGDRVLALRPQEEGLLLSQRSGQVWLAGYSTLAIEGGDAEIITDAVHRVGRVLLTEYRHQGAFSVSGWLRRGSFTPSRLITRTTRSHRHAMAGGLGPSWVVMNALASGGLLSETDLEAEDIGEYLADERRFVTMGLVTQRAPSASLVGRWLERADSGELRTRTQRSPTCVAWSATQDGGVLLALGLAHISAPTQPLHNILGEVLEIAATIWPETGVADMVPLPRDTQKAK